MVPVVAWNERVTISARLTDGSTIVGQDAISHPQTSSDGGGDVCGGDGSGSAGSGVSYAGAATATAATKATCPRVSTIVDKSTTGKMPLQASRLLQFLSLVETQVSAHQIEFSDRWIVG